MVFLEPEPNSCTPQWVLQSRGWGGRQSLPGARTSRPREQNPVSRNPFVSLRSCLTSYCPGKSVCPFPDRGVRDKAMSTTALSLLESGSDEDAYWKLFLAAALTLANQRYRFLISVSSLLLPLFLGFYSEVNFHGGPAYLREVPNMPTC